MNDENVTFEMLNRVGARIKAIRKKRKITQAELAGTLITRNMLSRIENGAALPSLTTLVYIADKLGIPSGCLLDDTALADHLRANVVREARELISQGKYEKALEVISDKDIEADDETVLIMMECDLNISRELIARREYFGAYEHLKKASALTSKTIYSSGGSGYIANLYATLAARSLPLKADEKSTPIPPDFDKYIDLYIYLRLIGMFDAGEIIKAVNLSSMCELSDKILSAHIAAKLDMANGRYNDAASKLKSIIDDEKRAPSAQGGLLLYRVFTDLEECAKAEGDYVSAYDYRVEKSKLFTAMSGIEL